MKNLLMKIIKLNYFKSICFRANNREHDREIYVVLTSWVRVEVEWMTVTLTLEDVLFLASTATFFNLDLLNSALSSLCSAPTVTGGCNIGASVV